MLILLFLLDLVSVINITLQPSGAHQNSVGHRQDVICSISALPGVDPNTIKLGWLNEHDIVTDDHRVTIDRSSDYFIDTNIVTTIWFDPLYEEDQDEYICYTIENGSFIYGYIDLQKLTSKHMCVY